MKKQILFLIVFAFVFTGCAEQHSPVPQSNVSEGTPPPADEEVPDIQEPPEGPEAPADDTKASAKVCYLQTSKGQTCFETHDLDDVNRAESKYKYVDSFNDPSFPSGLDRWQYRSPINLLFSSQHVSTAPLSKNFLRAEVLNANDSRGNYGFFSTKALHRIQQMREYFGKPLIINSGYRSPAFNSSLNGAARFSRHTYGDAIDFKIPGVSFRSIAKKCMDLGAGYYQIYSSHIHCDWRTTPLNEMVYGQDLRPNHIHAHSPSDVIQTLTHKMEIVTTGRLNTSTRSTEAAVQLSAKNVWLEDGEGVMYFWQVSQNGNVVETSAASDPVFLLKPGEYQVSVNVGGSLEKTTAVSIR